MATEDVEADKVLKTKKVTTTKQLCFGLPECIIEFINYIKGLDFSEKPDYSYCRELFERQLKENRFNIEVWNWDWEIQREKLIKKRTLEAENQRFEESLKTRKMTKSRKAAMRQRLKNEQTMELDKQAEAVKQRKLKQQAFVQAQMEEESKVVYEPTKQELIDKKKAQIK